MIYAFFLSIRVHVIWLFEAIGPRGRTLAPLRKRRLTLLVFGVPCFIALQACHWLGFLLDEIFFHGYRKTLIKEPLIITGIPRSGTAFLHSIIARDTGQFTTFRTWEALLAPSITERKLVRTLSRIDNRIGRPLHRLIGLISEMLILSFPNLRKGFLMEPGEDYLTLLPAGGCFGLVAALPASRGLWQLGRFQEIPDGQRRVWINYYRSCLQRHLYCTGGNRRLLSKNASFGSWLPDLRLAFPDARFIFCIREPIDALSSQLGSLKDGMAFYGTMAAADTVSLELQTVFAHVYRILLDETHSFLVDRLAVIDQSQFKLNTTELLETSLRKLCIPISESLHTSICEASDTSRGHHSAHDETPLTSKMGPREFQSLVTSIYEEILRHPCLSIDDLRR